jgi:hypothetical protein
VVALGGPATGSQFQISLQVPRAYQATAVDVTARGIVPGSLQILVDGHSVYRFAGMGGEWFWTLQAGTHRFQAIGSDKHGHPVRSAIAIVQVVNPQSPL